MCTLSGHAKTLEDSDAVSLKTYWNDLEEAASDRHTVKAGAWADYHLADYGARVTALTTMDNTLDTPWTGFLKDFAVAEESWWSTQKSQYLAYVGKVNAQIEGYQSTAGGKFVGMVESITTADVAWMTTAAPALATEATNVATAESRYVGRHATAKQTYQVDHATAMRDFTVNEDAPAKTGALAQAAKKYGIAEVSAKGDRAVDLAKARQQYVDAAQEATLTWTGTKSRAVRDFEVAESKAWRDRRVNLPKLDGDYAVQEADSYADAIELLATSMPTPWAELDAQQARAWAIDQAEWSKEALKSATASADADLQVEKSEAEAEQRRAMDDARANAKQEKAKAQAEVTKAEQERDAANKQAQAGAAQVGTPEPVAAGTLKAPDIEQAPPEDYTENRQSEKDDTHTLGDWSELPVVRDQTETTPAEEIDILVTPGKDESVVGDKKYSDGAPETIVYSDEMGTITEEYRADGTWTVTVTPLVGQAYPWYLQRPSPNVPPDSDGFPTGPGEWSVRRFFARSRYEPSDAAFGCGGMVALRAGFKPGKFMDFMSRDSRVFSELQDAIDYLRDVLNGNGLIVALQGSKGLEPYPKLADGKDGRDHRFDPKSFRARGEEKYRGKDVREMQFEKIDNFASLLGTAEGWYWEYADQGWLGMSGGTLYHRHVYHHKEDVAAATGYDWTLYLVIPGTKHHSPTPNREQLAPEYSQPLGAATQDTVPSRPLPGR